MITVINTIHLDTPLSRSEARRIYLDTAPTYLGMPGLLRKCYILSEDGRTTGGIYLWQSRAQADAVYTRDWRAFVRSKYGSEPTLVYFDTPVVVDNTIQDILADD